MQCVTAGGGYGEETFIRYRDTLIRLRKGYKESGAATVMPYREIGPPLERTRNG